MEPEIQHIFQVVLDSMPLQKITNKKESGHTRTTGSTRRISITTKHNSNQSPSLKSQTIALLDSSPDIMSSSQRKAKTIDGPIKLKMKDSTTDDVDQEEKAPPRKSKSKESKSKHRRHVEEVESSSSETESEPKSKGANKSKSKEHVSSDDESNSRKKEKKSKHKHRKHKSSKSKKDEDDTESESSSSSSSSSDSEVEIKRRKHKKHKREKSSRRSSQRSDDSSSETEERSRKDKKKKSKGPIVPKKKLDQHETFQRYANRISSTITKDQFMELNDCYLSDHSLSEKLKDPNARPCQHYAVVLSAVAKKNGVNIRGFTSENKKQDKDGLSHYTHPLPDGQRRIADGGDAKVVYIGAGLAFAKPRIPASPYALIPSKDNVYILPDGSKQLSDGTSISPANPALAYDVADLLVPTDKTQPSSVEKNIIVDNVPTTNTEVSINESFFTIPN